MASRKYKRNKSGQFSSSGTNVTFGKAGGFANATHRAAVQQRKVRKARNARVLRMAAKAAGSVAAVGLAGALVRGGVRNTTPASTFNSRAATALKNYAFNP